MDQHQQMSRTPNHCWLRKLRTRLQAAWILCLSSLPADLYFQMKCKIYFYLKRGPCTTEQQSIFFLRSPGKMLLTFQFQKWLGSPFPEDVGAWWLLMYWLFSPVLVKQSQVFESALPNSILKLAVIPCCLCTFSYQISFFQSTLHFIYFDTALCEQPPLSVMTCCDLPSLWRVSMIVFWTIDKSAVFPIIVVWKNKRYLWFIPWA